MPGVYTTFNKIKILLTVDIISLRVDEILFAVPGRVSSAMMDYSGLDF